jgi:transcriptional regulator with XRE-family HTH domain
MLLTQQIKAARALLGWTQEILADRAGLGAATIKRIEAKAGPATGQADSVWKIKAALENGGIAFIEDNGVRGAGVQLKVSSGRG